MKKMIQAAFSLSLILSASITVFAAEPSAGLARGERVFPSVKAISVVIPGVRDETDDEELWKLREIRMAEKATPAPTEVPAEEKDNSVQVVATPDPRWKNPGGAREATEEDMRQSQEEYREKYGDTDAIWLLEPAGAREATKEAMERAEERWKEKYGDTRPGEEAEEIDASGKSQYALSMTYRGQETKMSCGPACVRMVLEYLTGNPYQEKEIRNKTNYTIETGTCLSDLVAYLNEEQSGAEYMEVYQGTKDTMKNCLYNAIAKYGRPVIIGVQPSASAAIPWNGSEGHFLIIDSCNADKSEVTVLDPWGRFMGYRDGEGTHWYTLTMDDLYDGYSAINCGLAY